MSLDIKITKNNQSNIENTDFSNLKFGNTFTDHMFVCDYYDGQWRDAQIIPFGDLSLHPATFALHYGQSIFEGLKAEVSPKGEIVLFRPYDNAERFAHSARRISMPEVPKELFVKSIEELIRVDRNWIPKDSSTDNSLYIRPFLFGVDKQLGVKTGDNYKYVVIIGPVGSYYSEPVNVWIQSKYIRAFQGGTGSAKFSGNYSATLLPVMEAKQHNCQQILWTEGPDHELIQEIGTMNVFFVINGVLVTPLLDKDTILHGITRSSIITLAEDMGIKVEQRDITVSEVLKAYNEGSLQDFFGTGTAAVVYPISGFHYKDKDYNLKGLDRKISTELKSTLVNIKKGNLEDKHNWTYIIK